MAKFVYEHGFFKVKRKDVNILFFKEYETHNPKEIEVLRQMKVQEIIPKKSKKEV